MMTCNLGAILGIKSPADGEEVLISGTPWPKALQGPGLPSLSSEHD